MKTATLYIDQYANRFKARTRNELRKQIGNGSSRVSPMYIDGKDGKTYKVGYVIGPHWLTAYAPVREVWS